MAQLKKYSSKKLAAFSLFESVVAITIISVLIGIGTLIYGNIVEAEPPLSIYQAKNEIQKLHHELKTSGAYFSQNHDYEIFTIQQQVDFHRGNKRLYQVDYHVIMQDKKWYSEKHLIANPNYAE